CCAVVADNKGSGLFLDSPRRREAAWAVGDELSRGRLYCETPAKEIVREARCFPYASKSDFLGNKSARNARQWAFLDSHPPILKTVAWTERAKTRHASRSGAR